MKEYQVPTVEIVELEAENIYTLDDPETGLKSYNPLG